MGFYNVAYSYEYSTLMVGVEAETDAEAVDVALSLLEEEWGRGVLDYSDVNVEEIG